VPLASAVDATWAASDWFLTNFLEQDSQVARVFDQMKESFRHFLFGPVSLGQQQPSIWFPLDSSYE